MGLNDIFSSTAMLHRPTFRPRPIDVNRPMPIIREDVGPDPMGRTVKQVGSGMEAEEEEEKHLRDALRTEAAIPIPGVVVLDLPWKEEFKRPEHSYVRYSAPDTLDLEAIVEYDLLEDDYRFLEDLKVNSRSRIKITADVMELVIDRLEKCVGDKRKAVDKKVGWAALVQQGAKVSEEAYSSIYDFWSKRRRKHPQSYIPRYQNPPAPNDPSPYVAFRPREKAPPSRRARKNDQASYLKLIECRQDFERARLILETIKKRERLKCELAEAAQEIFRRRLFDFAELGHDYYDEYRREQTARAIERKKDRQRGKHPDHQKVEKKRKASKPPPHKRKRRLRGSGVMVDKEPYFMPWRVRPCLPYPRRVGDYICLGPNTPPFRGRVRLGRGGRVLFDRWVESSKDEGEYEMAGMLTAADASQSSPYDGGNGVTTYGVAGSGFDSVPPRKEHVTGGPESTKRTRNDLGFDGLGVAAEKGGGIQGLIDVGDEHPPLSAVAHRWTERLKRIRAANAALEREKVELASPRKKKQEETSPDPAELFSLRMRDIAML